MGRRHAPQTGAYVLAAALAACASGESEQKAVELIPQAKAAMGGD